jgi:hypothetical protein
MKARLLFTSTVCHLIITPLERLYVAPRNRAYDVSQSPNAGCDRAQTR